MEDIRRFVVPAPVASPGAAAWPLPVEAYRAEHGTSPVTGHLGVQGRQVPSAVAERRRPQDIQALTQTITPVVDVPTRALAPAFVRPFTLPTRESVAESRPV